MLKSDSNQNLILSKSDIVYSIQTSLDNYDNSSLNIDYSQINVSSRYYFRTNYKVPITIENIYDKKNIDKTDVITIGFIE